jgi:hypothetical protein
MEFSDTPANPTVYLPPQHALIVPPTGILEVLHSTGLLDTKATLQARSNAAYSDGYSHGAHRSSGLHRRAVPGSRGSGGDTVDGDIDAPCPTLPTRHGAGGARRTPSRTPPPQREETP